MARDVTFGFDIEDKASPKIKGIGNEMDKIGQRGIKKLTGDVGLATANTLGLAKGFGLVAAGITAATAVIGVMNRSLDIETDSLRQQQDLIAKKRDLLKQAAKQQEQLDAGGISKAASMRSLTTLGGSSASVREAVAKGIPLEEAIAGETEIQKLKGRKQYTTQQLAQRMAAAGVATYPEAVKQLTKSRGNIVNATISALGMQSSRESRTRAAEMLSDKSIESKRVQTFSKAITESSRVGVYQMGALESGKTTEALKSINQATLDPVETARKQYITEIVDTYKSLKALADASENMSSRFKNLAGAAVDMLPGGKEAQGAERFSRNVEAAGGL